MNLCYLGYARTTCSAHFHPPLRSPSFPSCLWTWKCRVSPCFFIIRRLGKEWFAEFVIIIKTASHRVRYDQVNTWKKTDCKEQFCYFVNHVNMFSIIFQVLYCTVNRIHFLWKINEKVYIAHPLGALCKLFNTKLSDILENCKLAFGLRLLELTVAIRKDICILIS